MYNEPARGVNLGFLRLGERFLRLSSLRVWALFFGRSPWFSGWPRLRFELLAAPAVSAVGRDCGFVLRRFFPLLLCFLHGGDGASDLSATAVPSASAGLAGWSAGLVGESAGDVGEQE